MWYVVDASGQSVGRLAARIATVLRGKHKPSFVPHLLSGDHVIVINAKDVKLTGRKMDQKVYYHHTGYFGGLKQESAKEVFEEKPEHIILTAVRGMLPRNTLRDRTMKRFHVFAGAEHTHATHNPVPLP